jgi:Ferritin-like domain
MLGAAGVAGAIGALTAVVAGRDVLAAPPSRPSEIDSATLSRALEVELAVSDLYAVAVAAGVPENPFATIAANHRAYAQAIAAMIGSSASGRDDAIFDQFESQFDSSDAATVAESAVQIEEALVNNHLQVLGSFEGTDPVELVTAILVVEGRHATVLNDVAGKGDDLQALLGSTDPASTGGAA